MPAPRQHLPRRAQVRERVRGVELEDGARTAADIYHAMPYFSPRDAFDATLAHLVDEDVNDDVCEVDEHPAALGVALDSQRTLPRLPRRSGHAVHDGLHVALGASGRNQEGICEGSHLADVQDDHVFAIFLEHRVHQPTDPLPTLFFPADSLVV